MKNLIMNLDCINGITPNGLIANFDISDLHSWPEGTGYTVNSLVNWKNRINENLFLYDFGLTTIDNGRSDNLNDSHNINYNDYLALFPVGENDGTGTTIYNNYEIEPLTGTTGNYFKLNGGYLQGFYKLEGYNHQLLPYRYANGFTYELNLLIEETSFENEPIFFYLGTRAENKYSPSFSGETYMETVTTTQQVTEYSNLVNQYRNVNVETNIEVINGVYTSEKNFLTNEEDLTEISDNVFSFKFNKNGSIGYRYIDSNNLIKEEFSTNRIETLGWNFISISFEPYEKIKTEFDLECMELRRGDLKIFVNGNLFWKISEFLEFYSRGYDIEREKQIGVPYNISWGGGSFGLKNSWHWEFNKREIYSPEINELPLLIEKNFNIDQDPCYDENDYTNNLLIETGTTVNFIDECDNVEVLTDAIVITPIINTGNTTNFYYIELDEEFEILSNREYDINIRIKTIDLFDNLSRGSIKLVYPSENVTVVKEISYKNLNTIDGEWFVIHNKIKTNDNIKSDIIKFGILIENNRPLGNEFEIYINEISLTGQDVFSKDINKENLIIEQYFDSSFIGGIQKLRIYDRPLTFSEISSNFKSEASLYGLTPRRGGRLIYV